MPRLVHRVPAYKVHKASGRARLRFQGRDIYLPGPFGSKESREAYARFIAEQSNRPESSLVMGPPCPDLLSISELVLLYSGHAKSYYRKNGKPTGEHVCIKYAVRPLEGLFGLTLAREFGPKKLKLLRDAMSRLDWTRRHINAAVRRIKRMFTWAAEEELLPGEVALNLRAVGGLKQGCSTAREKPEVGTVPDDHVTAALPYVSPRVRDLILVMRRSGMRPGEALSMTVEGLDRTDPECWIYRPGRHKTEHQGKDRVVFLGPRCQEVLLPRIMATGSGRLWPITARSLHGAIVKACRKAGVPRWAPNMLRHTYATEIRQRFGLEEAQVTLGHSKAATTEIYAERDLGKAREVARLVG